MDEFEKNRRIVEERKRQNIMKRKDSDRRRLEYNIEKKIRTTMIGALATFEDYFGNIWGFNKSEKDLSENQYHFRQLWAEARREVLNKGNMQIRAARDEISEYDTEWHRYTVDLIKKDKDNE